MAVGDAPIVVEPRLRWIPLGVLGAAVALLAVLLALVIVNVLQNSNAVNALRQDFDAVQAAQVAQAKASAAFIHAFIEQGNFNCRVHAAQAPSLGIPSPAPGLCSIKVPGG